MPGPADAVVDVPVANLRLAMGLIAMLPGATRHERLTGAHATSDLTKANEVQVPHGFILRNRGHHDQCVPGQLRQIAQGALMCLRRQLR